MFRFHKHGQGTVLTFENRYSISFVAANALSDNQIGDTTSKYVDVIILDPNDLELKLPFSDRKGNYRCDSDELVRILDAVRKLPGGPFTDALSISIFLTNQLHPEMNPEMDAA